MRLRLIRADGRIASDTRGDIWIRLSDGCWQCPFPNELTPEQRRQVRAKTGRIPEESYLDFMDWLLAHRSRRAAA